MAQTNLNLVRCQKRAGASTIIIGDIRHLLSTVQHVVINHVKANPSPNVSLEGAEKDGLSECVDSGENKGECVILYKIPNQRNQVFLDNKT